MIRKGLYILMAVVATMIVGGCATDSDSPEGGGTGTVRFAISAMRNHSSTRADDVLEPDGKPVEAESDNEMINDWWMVFVRSNGSVYKILERKEANPGLGANSATTPVEEEYFEYDLPRGTYAVYAFANIDRKEDAEGYTVVGNLKFKEGLKPMLDGVEMSSSLVSQIESIKSKAKWIDSEGGNLNRWSGNVPMSGFIKEPITVRNTVEETFSIEVVRMVAKIDFTFTNETASEITVNSVSIKPIPTSTTPISLLPTYERLGNKNYPYKPFDDDEDYEPLPYNPANPVVLPAKQSESADEAQTATSSNNRIWFYCKESVSNLPTNLFTIGVNITREKNGVKYDNEELLFSPTYQISNYINRNDWIKIPITFTDWIVDFDVMFYPPIGGYPAVKREDGTDGESNYFTFASQGKFVIIPRIKRADEDNWLQPDEYLTGMVISKPTDISGDGADIFSRNPDVDQSNNPYEIIGEFKDQIIDKEHPNGRTPNGMALIEVSFTPKSEPGVASQKVTRRIYIIRK